MNASRLPEVIDQYLSSFGSSRRKYAFKNQEELLPPGRKIKWAIQQRRGRELKRRKEKDERSGKRIELNKMGPASGLGSDTHPTPESVGLTFDIRALCPQGPEGSPCFLKKMVQAVGRFWE